MAKDKHTIFLYGRGRRTSREVASKAGALTIYSIPQAPQLHYQKQTAKSRIVSQSCIHNLNAATDN